MQATSKALSLEQFQICSEAGAFIIDTRSPSDVKQGYIPGSISIPVHASGTYTAWIGGILSKEKTIILIDEPEKEKETILKLANLGYKKIQGHLEGGFDAWVKAGKPIEKYDSVNGQEIATRLSENFHIIDVREKDGWEKGVLEGAKLINLPTLVSRINEVPKDEPVYVHCNSGGRSLSAYSILRALGYKNAVDIAGGLKSVTACGIQLKDPIL